jgi:hypothetical protein
MFTHLVWTLLSGVAFFGQLTGGGGAGSWIMGSMALLSLGVFIFSVFRGEKDYRVSDWISLGISLFSIGIWSLTGNPLFAIIFVSLGDAISYIPTFRKSWEKPHEETLTSYIFASGKFMIGIIALDTYSIVTVLYPAVLAVMSVALTVFLVWRRRIQQSEQ